MSLSTIIFSLIFLIAALQLPGGMSNSNTLASGTWPTVVLFLLLGLGITLLVKTWINNPKVENQTTYDEGDRKNRTSGKHKHWIIFGVFILYTYIMAFTGFTLTTLFFIMTITLLFGLKRKTYSVFIGIAGTAAFVLLFGVLLNIPLPRGVALFRELSFYLY
ncbi:tripartite tricarboxylate transporter TctB family protein [Salibacterium aidingense]|uniref:tripartite tricarboxylate transporter TctB family protein n=1 Tax=Salibacterium aidingense TaxID=384933 RepID=UPI003BC0E167